MKEIKAYKCHCGTLYEDQSEIRKCVQCGREICDDCAGFISMLCWKCNESMEEK